MDIPGYDAWKLATPWDDMPDEPEFECEECDDTGFTYPGELCPHCQQPMTMDDLEDLAADERSPS